MKSHEKHADGSSLDDVAPLVRALREQVAQTERQMINRRIRYH